MSSKGDELLFSKLERVQQTFAEYLSEATNLAKQVNYVLDRLRAIVYSNTENKIKAISRPDPKTISESIANIVEKMTSLLKIQQDLLQQALNECSQEKVQCDTCGGAGSIKEKIYVRDEDSINEIYQDKRCDQCNGLGFLQTTKPFSEQALIMLHHLIDLYTYDMQERTGK
ncbi:MAG: hypothetical protein QW555_07190 [Nitrososphaerota archaeon]